MIVSLKHRACRGKREGGRGDAEWHYNCSESLLKLLGNAYVNIMMSDISACGSRQNCNTLLKFKANML